MAHKKHSDFIDVKGLIRTYISKWYYFAISVFICCVLGFMYTRIHKQDMVVMANILIQDDTSGQMANFGGMASIFRSNSNVENEVVVVGSHSLFRNVAKELQINKTHYVKDGFLSSHLAYPDFPVDVVAPTIADTLRRTLDFRIKIDESGKTDVKVKVKGKVIAEEKGITLPAVVKTSYGEFTVTPTKYMPKGEAVNTTVLFSGYEGAAEALSKDVVCDVPNKRSNVITLELDSPNSEYASAILNEIIEQYNIRGIEEKNLQSEKTAEFLRDRIELLASDLNDAEVKIQHYKEANKLVDVAGEAAYQTEKRADLENALMNAETQIQLLNLTRDFLRDSFPTYDLVPSALDGSIQPVIDSYNRLAMKRIELMKNAKPNNAALLQLQKQMDAMRVNILSTCDQAYEKQSVRLRELKAEKRTLDSRLGAIPTQEREYLNMKRQQGVKQQLYLFLLQRQEETAILLANSVPKGIVIDQAYTLIEPIGMSNKMILFIAFVLGWIIPPVFIYLHKFFRNKFESREEVERHISAPVLGEMCISRSGENIVVAEHSNSSSAELFRLLRTNLQFVLSSPSDKVVLMTSTRSGEGKSFISINLAGALSLLGNKKVLLVGMDIRKPELANYIGLPATPGLTNYLSSADTSLESLIHHVPGFKNFDVIVAGPIPPNPAELLTSDKIDEVFARLREMYDYIIVDTAPVGMVSDTFTLDRISDATIYVTRANYSSMDDLEFIEEIYEDKRLKKLSVVVNGTTSKKGYGYGYSVKKEG